MAIFELGTHTLHVGKVAKAVELYAKGSNVDRFGLLLEYLDVPSASRSLLGFPAKRVQRQVLAGA